MNPTPPTQEPQLSAYSLAINTADRLSRQGGDDDQAAMRALARELRYAAMFDDVSTSDPQSLNRPSASDLALALGLLGSNGTASDTPETALRRRLQGNLAQSADASRLAAPSSKAVAIGRVAAAMVNALGFMRAVAEKLPKSPRPEPEADSIRKNYPREISELISYLVNS